MTSERSDESSDVDHDVDMGDGDSDVSEAIDEADEDEASLDDDVAFEDTDVVSSSDSQPETIHQTIEGLEDSADKTSNEASTNPSEGKPSKKYYVRRVQNRAGRIIRVYKQSKTKRPPARTHRAKDAYRRLLNKYINSVNNPVEADDPEPDTLSKVKPDPDGAVRPTTTYVGVTAWTVAEQDQLFSALSRYGIHDLPAMSQSIGTKSMLEIREYLGLLRTNANHHELKARRDRLWEGAAAIPAAAEIGSECEAVLQEAADRLRMKEEMFDREALEDSWGELGILDWQKATRLEERIQEMRDEADSCLRREANTAQTDGAEGDHSPHKEEAKAQAGEGDQEIINFLDAVPSSASPIDQLQPALSLLDLPNLLDLSARIFMNPLVPEASASGSLPRPNQDRNWYTMQKKSFRSNPAITAPCALDFFNLVITFTKRLISTTLHVAMSRSRATDVLAQPREAPAVLPQDVETACNILNLKTSEDWFEWWRYAARRNGLRVVETTGPGALRRGRTGRLSVVGELVGARLSYTQVERRLANKAGKKLVDGNGDEEEEPNEADELPSTTDGESSEEFFSLTSNEDLYSSDADVASIDWSSSSSTHSVRNEITNRTDDAELAEEGTSTSTIKLPPHITAEIEAAEAETAHLEYLDAATSKAEEARLFALLKIDPPPTDPDVSPNGRPGRPKMPSRKRKEAKDLVRWYDNLLPASSVQNRRTNQRAKASSEPGGNYVSEWQALCGRVPASAFARTAEEWARSRKRKRKEEKSLQKEERRKRIRRAVENGRTQKMDDDQEDVEDDGDTDTVDTESDAESDEGSSGDEMNNAGGDNIAEDDDMNDDDNDLFLQVNGTEDNSTDDDNDDGSNQVNYETAPLENNDDDENTALEHRSPIEDARTTGVNKIAADTSEEPGPEAQDYLSQPPPETNSPSQRQPSRSQRQARPANLQVHVVPLPGDENMEWPDYLPQALGAIEEESTADEWEDAKV